LNWSPFNDGFRLLFQDSPEQGVLYLLRLLLEVVKEFPFDTSNGSLCVIYFHILDMLSIAAQETYPYHIPNGKFVREKNRCFLFTTLSSIQFT
jgi:hypothetical protein